MAGNTYIKMRLDRVPSANGIYLDCEFVGMEAAVLVRHLAQSSAVDCAVVQPDGRRYRVAAIRGEIEITEDA